MYVDLSKEINCDVISLDGIIKQICDKYNITYDMVRFDYVETFLFETKYYYNMILYGKKSNLIEKPNDPRGFWVCMNCRIICLNPLKFTVDGITFTVII